MDETKEGTKYTPTPWKARGRFVEQAGEVEDIALAACNPSYSAAKANAAHIVRCVNAWDDAESLRLRLIELNPAANDEHDELVALLEVAIRNRSDSSHPWVLAARAALAKAGA